MKNTTSGGIGFLTILFFIFLILKLCGQISWSWWYVTMPLWIIPSIIATFIAVLVLSYFYKEVKK